MRNLGDCIERVLGHLKRNRAIIEVTSSLRAFSACYFSPQPTTDQFATPPSTLFAVSHSSATNPGVGGYVFSGVVAR